MSDEQTLATGETFIGLTKATAALALAFVSTLGWVLSVVVFIVVLHQVEAQTHQGQKAKVVLCAIKGYERDNIQQSQAYLAAHPDGAPALHLNRAYFEHSLQKAQAFAAQFDGLGC